MITEETLRKVGEAFRRVQRDSDLRGWGLDDKLISPFTQEPDSTGLVIGLLRGSQSGRASPSTRRGWSDFRAASPSPGSPPRSGARSTGKVSCPTTKPAGKELRDALLLPSQAPPTARRPPTLAGHRLFRSEITSPQA